MSKWPACWRAILVLVLSAVWSGCLPIAETPLDEEKDPNFIEGKNHQNAMDYKSAIAAFERAVQSNPRNAAAHFELGLLYDQKNHDFVSAIYHYQKHLELRPKSEYAEAVKPMITACKLELAKTVTFGVVTREVHRDMERMTNDMALLRQQNEALRAQLAAKPMVLTQWMTLRVTNFVTVAAKPAQAESPAGSPAQGNTPAQAQPAAGTPAPTRVESRASQTPTPSRPSPRASQLRAPRAHKVAPGETLSEISRRYGVTVQALQSANGGLNPKKLRAGQTLVVPSP